MSASGSQYDVSVRLTTIGTADLSASMNSAKGSMQNVATELDKTNVAVTRMSTAIRGVTADGDKYSITMKIDLTARAIQKRDKISYDVAVSRLTARSRP